MTWTWGRLADFVWRLELPTGSYAVGQVGADLAHDRRATADDVVLFVTEISWALLADQGWLARGGVLLHPQVDGLTARTSSTPDVITGAVILRGVAVVAEAAVPPRRSRGGEDRTLLTKATARLKALGESESTWHAAWMAGLLFLVIAYVALAIFGPGLRHLAFQTTAVQASIVTYTVDGECKGDDSTQDRTKYRLTLAWVDDGEERLGDYTTCDDPTGRIGDPVEAWVTGGGDVAALDSPLRTHLLALVFPAGVTAIGCIVALGFVGVTVLDDRRRDDMTACPDDLDVGRPGPDGP